MWKEFKEKIKARVSYYRYKIRLGFAKKKMDVKIYISELREKFKRIIPKMQHSYKNTRSYILIKWLNFKTKYKINLEYRKYRYNFFMRGYDSIHHMHFMSFNGKYDPFQKRKLEGRSDAWSDNLYGDMAIVVSWSHKLLVIITLLYWFSFLDGPNSVHILCGPFLADTWTQILAPFVTGSKIMLSIRASRLFFLSWKHGQFGLTMRQASINKKDHPYVDFFIRFVLFIIYLFLIWGVAPSWDEFLKGIYTEPGGFPNPYRNETYLFYKKWFCFGIIKEKIPIVVEFLKSFITF